MLEPGADESEDASTWNVLEEVGVAGFDPLRMRTGDPPKLPGGGIGWLCRRHGEGEVRLEEDATPFSLKSVGLKRKISLESKV